jgi:hypothetical protein
MRELDNFNLSDDPDRVSWALEPSGKFSASSMYKCLLEDAVWPCAKIIRETKLVLKIKIFTW